METVIKDDMQLFFHVHDRLHERIIFIIVVANEVYEGVFFIVAVTPTLTFGKRRHIIITHLAIVIRCISFHIK